MRRVRALAAAIALATILVGSASPTSSDVWKKLHRPLHLPLMNWQDPCVTTNAATLERSVAYPVLAQEEGQPVVSFEFPARKGRPYYGSPWGGANVAWVVRGDYRGPLLIRGRQLDGTRIVHFEGGQIPATERRIHRVRSNAAGFRRYSSVTRLRAPGCYAYQVDGLGFSRVFVFAAELEGPTNEAELLTTLRARGLPMKPAGSFPSIAFDLFGLTGERFANPTGDVVVWQFGSFAAAQAVLIDGGGYGLKILHNGGQMGAAIFCVAGDPVPTCNEPASPHWYRRGSVLALYLGTDPNVLRVMNALLGDEIALP